MKNNRDRHNTGVGKGGEVQSYACMASFSQPMSLSLSLPPQAVVGMVRDLGSNGTGTLLPEWWEKTHTTRLRNSPVW